MVTIKPRPLLLGQKLRQESSTRIILTRFGRRASPITCRTQGVSKKHKSCQPIVMHVPPRCMTAGTSKSHWMRLNESRSEVPCVPAACPSPSSLCCQFRGFRSCALAYLPPLKLRSFDVRQRQPPPSSADLSLSHVFCYHHSSCPSPSKPGLKHNSRFSTIRFCTICSCCEGGKHLWKKPFSLTTISMSSSS